MTRDLERVIEAARKAHAQLGNVLNAPDAAERTGVPLDGGSSSGNPTRDDYARAIWDVRSEERFRHGQMTWADLCEFVSDTASPWAAEYERVLRQADAVMELNSPAPNLTLALRVAVGWLHGAIEADDVAMMDWPILDALKRVAAGIGYPEDWRTINEAASKRD